MFKLLVLANWSSLAVQWLSHTDAQQSREVPTSLVYPTTGEQAVAYMGEHKQL